MMSKPMRSADLRVFPGYARLWFPPLRVNRADQVREFFALIDKAFAHTGASLLLVSLEEVSFARVDEIKQQVAAELGARAARREARVLWVASRLGDMAFWRSAAGVARVAPGVFQTEREALLSLGIEPANA
jgi:hypothetical protein